MNSLRAVTGIPGASSVPIDRRYYPHPIQPAPPALQPIAPAPPVSQPPQSQPYSQERQLEHVQSHLGGHTYDLHSALHSPHTVIDNRQQQPQLSQQGNCYDFGTANSNDYSLPLSTSTEIQPTGPSPLYGGPAAVQQPGYNGTGTIGPCLPSQTSVPVGNGTFNLPISGPYSIPGHQPESSISYGGDIRRFPGPPNDEEVSSYYTE